MIKVLQNWQEIQAATEEIKSSNLPLHFDIHKNWDHLLLYQLVTTKDKQFYILDLGCGECSTLDFLTALGFGNLHGIDLKPEPKSATQPYALYTGNLTQTPFLSDSCDLVVNISVIEHGVDLPAFFAEVSRLLKPEGLLFLTTDYWQEPITVDSSIKPFGLKWQIFSAADIEKIIDLAKINNLILEGYDRIPACSEKPINWHYDYTFIALLFRKKVL